MKITRWNYGATNSFLQKLTYIHRHPLNDTKVPVVRKDKSLNKYSDKVLFPDKVEKAKQAYEKLGLPDLKENSHQQPRHRRVCSTTDETDVIRNRGEGGVSGLPDYRDCDKYRLS